MTDELETTGMDRRQLLRRGALVGGAVVWATPVVQSLSPAAYAAGSPFDDGGNGAPSWVMVWFKCGDSYHLVKYGQNASASCVTNTDTASNDVNKPDAVDAKAALAAIFAKYGPYDASCPAGVVASISADSDLLLNLSNSDCEIVDWFLHDGSCKDDEGSNKFRWQGDGQGDQVAIIYNNGAQYEFQKCKD
jgi:hypothetical protein